jgi:hypothetical protein
LVFCAQDFARREVHRAASGLVSFHVIVAEMACIPW